MNSKRYKNSFYKVREVTDLKDIIMQSTDLFPNKVAYLEKDKKLGEFVPITYSKVKEDLDALGTMLIELGLGGDKIAVIGDTSYHWILTYFTVVAGVGTIVPLDKNLPQDELMGLVERSGAKAIFYGAKSEKNIKPLFENPFEVENFVSLDDETKKNLGENNEIEVLSLKELIEKGKELLAEGDKRYINAYVDPDEMATLMYTSGTTGLAKGVMLSQRNIAANVQNMSMMFEIPEPGIVLSILPVHHAYEMTCDIWTTFYQGKTIAICQGLKYIQKNMAEVHANVMLGVPLVFEKMYKGMFKQAESRGEADKLRNAIALSKKLKLYNNKAVVRRMFKAIHQSFGGEMQKFVAGGAAIDPKVIEDFEAMGFSMIQGYGMSENAPIIAVNKDRYSKAASVGLPMPGTDVRVIDSDEDGIGEIICRGPSVMLGYYDNPEATAEMLHNGWLHTGDLGYIDEEGFVYLTGRKKTVIVTKGGKNIFPEEVEAVLMEDEHIQEVLIHGVTDSRVGNVMITADIYPNYTLLKSEKGDMTSADIYHYYKDLVEEINKSMPAYKQVKRINIRTEEFIKTTTGKIKRFGNTLVTNSTDSRGRASFNEIREGQIKRARKKAESVINNGDPFIINRAIRPITDIKQMLETSVDNFGEKTALLKRISEELPAVEISYKQLLIDVNALGTAMINRGLKNCKIAIAGKNSYMWAVSYLATVCGTGVVVPLDRMQDSLEAEQLIREAGIECIIFDKEYMNRFKRIREKTDNSLETLICIDSVYRELQKEDNRTVSNNSEEFINVNPDDNFESKVLSWEKLLEDGRNLVAQGDRQFLDAEITADDMAAIIYTAGTTGSPKGVMLSHTNICDNIMSAAALVKVETADLLLSVMPLNKTYECTCGLLMSLYLGAAVAFCNDLSQLYKRFKEIKPSIILVKSSMAEELYKKLETELKKDISDRKFNNRIRMNKIAGKIKLNILNPFKKKVDKIFGGNLRMIISGDGRVDRKILDLFNQVGILGIRGYGITECSPMVAINPAEKGKMRNDSEGHLLPGMEIKIRNKDSQGIGEIVVKGVNVMQGYFNDPEGTAEVLKDGWFYTGDVGFVDEDKFIYIVGRKDNVIITKDGNRIYPEELENYLKCSKYIEDAMVWGRESEIDPGEITVAVTATLKRDSVEKTLGEDYDIDQARDLVWEEIDKLNESLPHYERVKKIIIRNEEFKKTTSNGIKRFEEVNKEGE